jgi:hypothetical protein
LWEIHREVEKQPQTLQEKMENVFLEGSNTKSALHKHTAECTRIFHEVNDWMGIITRHNQTLEDVRARIQLLNEEFAVTMDLLEKQEKFD